MIESTTFSVTKSTLVHLKSTSHSISDDSLDPKRHTLCQANPNLAKTLIIQGKKCLSQLSRSDSSSIGASKDAISSLVPKGCYQKSQLSDKSTRQQLLNNSFSWSLFTPFKKLNRFCNSHQDNSHVEQRKDYLFSILSVMWAIYNQSALNNKAFNEGSFKIKDHNGHLFNFLVGYVKFSCRSNHPDKDWVGSPFGYPRNGIIITDSHYNDPKFGKEIAYGIDIRIHGDQNTLRALPTLDKTHILFGRIKIEEIWFTYLKFERVGLGSTLEIILHGLQYFYGPDKDESYRGEKLPPTEIQMAFRKYCQETKRPVDKEIKEVNEMLRHVKLGLKKKDTLEYSEGLKFLQILRAEGYLEYAKFQTGRETTLSLSRIS